MPNNTLAPSYENLPIVLLTDVDGTASDTRTHMQGYNARLAAAFPEIPAGFLEELGAARVAYRKDNGHLTHAQQSTKWETEHPGLAFDSQTSFMQGTAPDIFTPKLMQHIRAWGENPDNFGHGEYGDLEPYVARLREIGAIPLLYTLGSRESATGEPGWQHRKVMSGPVMRMLPHYITESLPNGGKGQEMGIWYDKATDTFLTPRTDGGEPIRARGVVLVDDVLHNVEHVPGEAMAVLLDRQGKYSDLTLPPHIQLAHSLTEVPAMVEAYDTLRRHEGR